MRKFERIIVGSCMGAFYVLAILAPTLAAAAEASVEYLPEKNVLLVRGYSEQRPCTPQDLARLDERFGWGTVTIDAETGAYAVDCGLQIGLNDGSSTYFQVGSETHPEQTLIVKGNVRVHSTWLEDENSGHWRSGWEHINRMTLGVKGNPDVKAALLIDNRTQAGYTLIIGGFNGNVSANNGGELCVYNSTIASVGDVQIGEGIPSRAVYMGGSSRLELINATVRDVKLEFARRHTGGLVMDSRFENNGVGYLGTYQEVIRGSTFSGNERGLTAASRRNLVLYECVFKNNEINWDVPHGRLVAVDCTVDSYDKGLYSSERNTFFIAKRHVVVRVTNSQGVAIEGATVEVTSEEKPPVDSMDVWHAVTGADGRTPGSGAKDALLLSEILIQASQVEAGESSQTTYQYVIDVSFDGRSARANNVNPAESWQEVVIVLDDE